MIGVEILGWHTDPFQTRSTYSFVRKYVFGDVISHCSMKITIPSTQQLDNLVSQYCLNEEGETLIPHFKTEVIVKSNETPTPTKKVPAWVIYFSFWPNQLATEFDDSHSANTPAENDFAKGWGHYQNDEMVKQRRGMLGYWLGDSLYDLLFGQVKKIPAPIQTFVHIQENQEQWMKDIAKARNHYKQVKSELKNLQKVRSDFIQAMEQVNLALDLLHKKQFEARFLSEDEQKKIADDIQCFSQKGEKICQYSYQFEKTYEESKQENREAKRVLEQIFYSQAASYGCLPTDIIWLPIQGHNTLQGLTLEPMLKRMNQIANSKKNFDMLKNNCSLSVHEILLVGLSKELCKELIVNDLVHFSDLDFSRFEHPEQIVTLSQQLQKAFFQYHMLTLTRQAHESQVQITMSPSVLGESYQSCQAQPSLAPEERMTAPMDFQPTANTCKF